MAKHKIMGLFSNFKEAFKVVDEIKAGKLNGVSLEDVSTKSPIEHPEIDEVLEHRKSPVPYFTLCGALFGVTFGFLFLASAQATFLVQPQGGKPVVPLPSNIVLSYEMLILFGVIATLIGFLTSARMLTKRSSIYSEKVGIDQIGIVLELDDNTLEPAKQFFKSHQVLEIREEVAR